VREEATSADGTAISWWRSGSGPPLVLVHGTAADHARWAPVRPLLEPHVELCAIDRRGRGASGDTAEHTLAAEVNDLVAVVEAVATAWGGPVDVLGHSYGALCALEAVGRTGGVHRLALYEPPLLAWPEVAGAALADHLDQLLDEGRRDEVLSTFFRSVVGLSDEQLAGFRQLPAWPHRLAAAHTLGRELRAVSGYRFDPAAFAGLAVPVLLVQGGDSPAFLQESSRAGAAALPSARLVVLDGQQHVAMDTAPELFARTVLEFVRPG
jgi:pimeloyl-ACP methyl ester carboxylesterase